MPFNVSPKYLKRVSMIESGNDPLAMNPRSSAKGLYQFTDPVAGQYGLDDPTDPAAATEAMKSLTADNYSEMIKLLGRPPSEAELYLAHQQGATGAAKLIQNPDAPAASVVGEKQVINNGGTPSMTASEFANKWMQKYNSTPAQPLKGTEFASSGQIMSDAPDGFGADDEVVDFGAGDEVVNKGGGLKNNNVPDLMDTGKFRTAIDNFNQGTMMGWGSEITDPLATFFSAMASDPQAAMRGEVSDPALANSIAGLRDNSMQNLAAGRSENPWTAGLSQVGGSLTGAIAASKVIPKGISTRAAAIAKAAPKLTAGAIGGGSSVINSLGEAEGTGLDRFDNVGAKDLLGIPAGIGGYWAGKALGKGASLLNQKYPQIGNAITSAARNLGILDDVGGAGGGMPPPPAAGATPLLNPEDVTPMKMAGILDEADVAKLQQGRVLPMTAGEKTQNVKIQRMEEIAKKSGSEDFQKAVTQQQQAAAKPLTSVLGDNQQIDPIALGHRTQDEMQNAANIVQGQYDALGDRVHNAYSLADKLSVDANGQPIAISGQYTKNNLFNNIDNYLALEAYKSGEIPKLDNHINDLKELVTTTVNKSSEPDMYGGFKTITSSEINNAKIADLEKWKKQLNRSIGNTLEPADKRLLQMVGKQYDQFMANTADDAIVNGDTAAIDAFKNARSLASQKFKFYDSDSSIQKILDNRGMSGTNLVNTILGANRMTGKGDDGRIVETMLDLAGDKAPQMQDAMRKGVMAKVLNDSLSGVTDPSTVNTAAQRNLLDFGKMKKSLGSLMQQRETFKALFNQEEQQYFTQMYKDISQIASKQPGAVNNSSTGSYIADMVTGLAKITNNPLFAKMSLGGTHYLQKGLEAHAASIVTGKAEKGLGDFLVKAINQVDAPAAYYGGIAGSQAVDPIGDLMLGPTPEELKNSYHVTVTTPRGAQ